MVTRNTRIRFCDNNLAAASASVLAASSAQASFPLTNLTDSYRFRRWKPAGNFTVTSANNLVYINDGSNKTVTLTAGNYTYSTLAAHIQTQLNASSSNWTCTYSTTTFKFTVGRSSGTSTLRFTQTTNAAWDMLGYTGTLDTSAGTGLAADAVRCHTSEYVTVDLGVAQSVTFFALLGPLGQVFSLSNSASLKLYGNTTSNMTSPALTVTVTPSAHGAMSFLDNLTDSTYRYWKVEIIDRTNTLGPLGFDFGHLYLGDYTTITRRNVASGLKRTQVDSSKVQESAGGALFFRRALKYDEFDQAEINYLDATDKATLEQTLYDLGKSTPFYVSFDPTQLITTDIADLTRYVVLKDDPVFTHIKSNVWSVALAFREVM